MKENNKISRRKDSQTPFFLDTYKIDSRGSAQAI
jgi:hypothetical protein